MLLMIVDIASALVVPVLLVCFLMKYWKVKETKKKVLLILLTMYLCEMFNIVGIPAVRYFVWNPSVNLIPFSDFGVAGFIFQVSMNAVMLIPMGFLLPMIWDTFKSAKVTVLTGFLTSLLIEVIQLFSFRATDIDDLIMNTLGCGIGYLLIWLFSHKKWNSPTEIREKRGSDMKQFITVFAIPLLTIIFVRSLIFSFVYKILMKVGIIY